MAQKFNAPFGTAGKAPAPKPQSDQQAAVQHAGGKPMMTHHHPDGHHTTEHDDGSSHDSQNLEELKSHLDKFFTEEEGEGDDWGSDDDQHDAHKGSF